MFEKTLTDIVKGIRASKRDTALYISQCIAEIKTEINSSDMYVKSNALQKLTFLQMMGYSMSWASFATIEVMSSPRFAHKRIGYLAASQGFTRDTEVTLLTTNLLKKELRGAVGGAMHGVYEAGLAINCLSNIVTEDLARDLLPDLVHLTTHPQPYLRKKAILCLFKVFVQYPQGLRLTFAQLQQCLDDTNISVVSCAVNVITELSDKNPRNYLHLAPAFFQLVTQSSNNWMLIKVVKLLGSLVPEEPRLARKLLEPLSNIVKNTQAKSLLYEAVYTITLCLPYCRKSDGSMPAVVPEIVELCASTLRSLVEERDENLKYLGLVGFASLMQSHSRVLSAPDYRPLILACLSHEDVTIRTRALDLLVGMVSRKNLVELVSQLLKHVENSRGQYKLDLVSKIVELCSGEKYALLSDFTWYLDTLFYLGHMRGIEAHGELLKAQITDVALRVLPVRVYAVQKSIEVLMEGDGTKTAGENDTLMGDNGRGKHLIAEILPAVAWIIGEYSSLIPQTVEDTSDNEVVGYSFDENSEGTYHAIIQALMTPANLQKVSADTQKVYVQAAMKVFAAATTASDVEDSELEACISLLHRCLPIFVQSTDVEVVERAFSSLELLKSCNLAINTFDDQPELSALSNEDCTDNDDDDDDKESDLLGIQKGSSTVKAIKESKVKMNLVEPRSLAKRARDASSLLNYLHKPEPMKPVGAKSQKKKYSAPIGVNTNLEEPVNLSLFEELILEEEALRNNNKITLDTVSFTQQRMFIVEPSRNMVSLDTPMDSVSFNDSSFSFQHTRKESGMSSTTPRPKEADPFYLISGPTEVDEQNKTELNRFGTIQLLDSDEDEQKDKHTKKKKKKDKKLKETKTAESAIDSAFSVLEGKSMPLSSVNSISSGVMLYDSDDDEDGPGALIRRRGNQTKKGFDSLAKVDLINPLRDDEVMLERKHYVVPDKPLQPQQHNVKVEKETRKKSKKSKKGKKAADEETDAVGDLLDLGVFGDVGDNNFVDQLIPSVPAITSPVQSNNNVTNPINAAFDDLLGLDQLPTATQLTAPNDTGFEMLSATSLTPINSSGNKGLLRATIKLSNTSSTGIQWNNVQVLYKVKSVNSSNRSMKLVFSVVNESSTMLQDVSLEIKGHEVIKFGSVVSNSSSESKKVGPFSLSNVESSEDVKGKLHCAGVSVPIKMSLPVAVFLNPESGLTIDQIANQLAKGVPSWTNESLKIHFTTSLAETVSINSLKQAIIDFTHAALVVDDNGSSIENFTLAAISIGQVPVRILAKIKSAASLVKIDIKSPNATLAKSLAGDLKRLVL